MGQKSKTHRLIAMRRKSIRPRSDQSVGNRKHVMVLKRHHRDAETWVLEIETPCLNTSSSLDFARLGWMVNGSLPTAWFG